MFKERKKDQIGSRDSSTVHGNFSHPLQCEPPAVSTKFQYSIESHSRLLPTMKLHLNSEDPGSKHGVITGHRRKDKENRSGVVRRYC